MEEETTQIEKTVNITYEVDGTNLKEVKTPTEIQAETTTYNIPEIQAEIAKNTAMAQKWLDLNTPLQALVDKYNEIAEPVVEEPIEK